MSKYVWVVPLKDERDVTIAGAFHKTLNESRRKLNRIWVDKGSKFCNKSLKSWLQNNKIETYSTHNGGKSVVAEGFIKTLKSKIYK